MRKTPTVLATTLALTLTGCGYNTFQSSDEQIKASWSEVVNQYQRRADLVPNLVATVKGEAKFEQDTLTKVIEARAKATSIQVTPELINDPAAFQKFQAAQGELTGALSRLMVVSENYPTLRANQGFRDLSAQLEGFREPHHGGAQPLHQVGAGLQRDGAVLPVQSDGDGDGLQGEAHLHRGQRKGNLQAAQRHV
jgi:hypothetical protein